MRLLKKKQESIQCFEKSLEIDPSNLNALNGIAYAKMSKKNRDVCIEYFDRILEIDPDFKVGNTGYPRLELLIRHHSAIFESKKTQQGPKKKNVVFVRIRKPTDN